MAKTATILLVVGILVGVVAGYGVGFVVYQPQISKLQSDLSEAQDNITLLETQLTELAANYRTLSRDYEKLYCTLYNFSLQVIPAQIEDAVAGQRCVFLVVVADEGEGIGKGVAVDISATTLGSAVTVDPQATTSGQVAEVTVIPDEASANSTLTVTITGEREGSKQTETTTIDVWEGLAGPLEEEMSPLATEIRDKFIPWLAVSHPEFGITDETEWTETIVRPHIQVVMFCLFFSDDWEMGVSWHVTVPPHDWARIYLRH